MKQNKLDKIIFTAKTKAKRAGVTADDQELIQIVAEAMKQHGVELYGKDVVSTYYKVKAEMRTLSDLDELIDDAEVRMDGLGIDCWYRS